MKTKLGVFFLFLLTSLGFAQLRANLDYAIFNAQDESVVEFYYSLPPAELTFVKEDSDTLKAYFYGQLQILKEDEVYKNFAWKNVRTSMDTSKIPASELIVDQITISLPAGEYVAHFSLQDLNAETAPDTITLDLNVPGKRDEIYFSEIEIASTIRKATPVDQKSPFYKNTLYIQPNPSLLYSNDVPMLFFYSEIYNIPSNIGAESYTFTYKVTDINGSYVPQIDAKSVSRKNASPAMVEFGYLNVAVLPGGAYSLVLELVHNDRVLAEQKRDFYVYHPEQKTAVQNSFDESIFAVIDSQLVINEFDQLNYIISKDDHDVYNSINAVDEKRHFVFDFWNRNNPNISVAANPMRHEYLRRVDYANEHFRAYKKDGWRTDRGRVYIMYGEPNEVDRYPNEPQRVPYVIWTYHKLQNGVQFIFAEIEGNNDYQLVHSDLYGEIQNRNYDDILKSGIF